MKRRGFFSALLAVPAYLAAEPVRFTKSGKSSDDFKRGRRDGREILKISGIFTANIVIDKYVVVAEYAEVSACRFQNCTIDLSAGHIYFCNNLVHGWA